MRRHLRSFLLLFLSAPLLQLVPGAATAQIKGDPLFNGSPAQQSPGQKSGSRLSQELRDLNSGNPSGGRKIQSAQKPLPGATAIPSSDGGMGRYLQIKGSSVVVDISVNGDVNTAKASLQQLGLRVTGVYGRVISGLMPIAALSKLDSNSLIRYARPAFKPLHQGMTAAPAASSMPGQPKGSIGISPIPGKAGPVPAPKIKPVISQGDTAMLSYVARKKYKVDGSGVKIGVLSDSYNNLGGAATGVANGELPGPANPFNYKKPVQVLEDLDSTGTDEGRAMLEIVHDIAPGSELAFHTAFNGQADFAQGILDLRKAGCDVIADDIVYFSEPFFQDGIIAQAVDQAKQQGATYFSSAGNQSVRSYESIFRDSAFEPLGPGSGTAHNFSGPGATPRYFQPLYIPPGGSIILSFQYDQSSFSASGVGPSSDLDVYLLDSQGNLVAWSASDNLASGEPSEILGYYNNTNSPTFYLVVLKYAGPDPDRIKYILYNDALFYLTNPAIPGILSPTLVGHAKAAGAIATGAAFYINTPPYGVDTPQVENFSAEAGVANYYDIQGNRIPPLIRRKPEIVTPDGVSTSFFGEVLPNWTDTMPHFFGTSAAAPHGAGVAALMIQAQKLRTITPDQIKGVLEKHTWDMDDVYTPGFDVGFDYNTGYGLVKADKAVGEVKFPNVYIDNLKLSALCSPNPTTQRYWNIHNPNPFPVEASWLLAGTSQHGSIYAPPGDTSFSTTNVLWQGKPLPSIVLLDWQDNFEFPRFDLAYGSSALCGKDQVSAANSDQLLSKGGNTLSPGFPTGFETTRGNMAEVYPNPSPGVFKLYLSLAGQDNTTLELFSTDGKRMFIKQIAQSNGVIDIDASPFQPGIYLLKITQGSFVKTIKLIRQ